MARLKNGRVVGRISKSQRRAIVTTDMHEAMAHVYEILKEVEKTVDECHAKETKRSNAVAANVLATLRQDVGCRVHRVGCYIGEEDPVEMKVYKDSALAFA